MKKLFFLIFLNFVFVGFLRAQEEASNWFFGENAGIEFNIDGSVTSVNTGQLNTREGCASISDQNGNLLFYTDGTTVYNRNHAMMSNGFGLKGDSSSTQSAIVVPKPNDPDIYYIFTVGSNLNPLGLNYSIVDITQSGGLGAVVAKNISLLANCSEKVTAVLKDCDSQEIWVITLANGLGLQGSFDTFYAYLVTDTGVNSTPVTTPITTLPINDSRGYLKLSPDGTKIACANLQSGMFLFDFDTQTGLVSNPLQLTIPNSNNKPYGVEFSPNSNLLYVTASNDYFPPNGETDSPSDHHSVLVQYDLTNIDINSTSVILDDRQLYRSGLQLGPNGKIYRALSATYDQGLPFLGVIHNPNNVGSSANYQHNAVSLGGRNSTQGLPPFIQSFFIQKIDIIRNSTQFTTYLPLCDGDTYTLIAEEVPGAIYTWTFDDTVLPETSYTLDINQSGNYEVLIDFNDGSCDKLEGEAFVEYFENPIALDATLFQCDQDGVADGITLFNLTEANLELADNNPQMEVRYFDTLQNLENGTNELNANSYENNSNPEIIYALVTNPQTNCSSYSQLTLEVSTTVIGDYSFYDCDELDSEDGINTFDMNIIRNDILNGLPNDINLHFYITYTDALLEQNEIPDSYQNSTPYLETIYARAENENDCYGIGEITLIISPRPQLAEDETTYYCLNYYPETITLESGNLDSNLGDYTYLWSTGETTESIEVNQPGNYTITVTNSSTCDQSRTITVEASDIATIDDITVQDGSLSFNNTVTVEASGIGTYHYALFNQQGAYRSYQESNVFENVVPGFYYVRVRDIKNDCGVVEQLISVIGFPRFFTPNNDGYRDTWQVYGLSEQFQPNTKILIFDRFGKLLKQLDPLGIGWDGTFNGETLPNDDYWFAVTLQDGRIFRSHFTLKR